MTDVLRKLFLHFSTQILDLKKRRGGLVSGRSWVQSPAATNESLDLDLGSS